MNSIRKLYCRAFQLVFRIALPFLPYREPKLLEGVQGVAELLARKNVSQVLLVTDKGIRSHGLTRPLEDALAEADIGVSVFDDTVANPHPWPTWRPPAGCIWMPAAGPSSPLAAVQHGLRQGLRRAHRRPNKPLAKMEGLLHVMRPLPLLIAVPTTAGTGSETTLAAVITDGETHHKYPINDFALIPPYALLDPEVTVGLPPQLTATTGMDAMTHAVEAYIGGSTTRGTRQAAVEAVRLILESLPVAYAAAATAPPAPTCCGPPTWPALLSPRAMWATSMRWRTLWAGSTASPTAWPTRCCCRRCWKPTAPRRPQAPGRLAVEVGVASVNDTPAQASAKFIAKLRKMNADMGIPRTLEGIREEDLPALARHADHEGNPLYPVPVLMDANELQALYRLVMPKTEENTNDAAADRTGGAKAEGILFDGAKRCAGVSHQSA